MRILTKELFQRALLVSPTRLQLIVSGILGLISLMSLPLLRMTAQVICFTQIQGPRAHRQLIAIVADDDP
jgi:hypothetical protein